MSDKFSRPDNASQPENQPSQTQPELNRPLPPRRNWLHFIFRYAAIYVAIILLFRFVIPSYVSTRIKSWRRFCSNTRIFNEPHREIAKEAKPVNSLKGILCGWEAAIIIPVSM
jgi:hypothetical protein